MELPKVDIYSDGGARPNPGAGGYGVILSYKGIKKEFYKGYKITTNNRMELTGVITGLEKLKVKSSVNIYTDSKYTIDGIDKGWAKKRKQNNWLKSNKTKAVNTDLWDKLLLLVAKHEVRFNWVKGHNGHIENERCDELATIALKQLDLIDDIGFELQPITDKKLLDNKKELLKKVLNKNTDPNISKIKITEEGQACKKCGDNVIKKAPKTKNTKNKNYYYKYYLICSSCNTIYMVDKAKVMIN